MPPFNPPYKAMRTSDGVERWVDVAADGTETPTATPTTVWNAMPTNSASEPAAPRKGKSGVQLLNVPYAEKDEAKQLGAKWDATRRKWYVPAGVDAAAFSRWVAD